MVYIGVTRVKETLFPCILARQAVVGGWPAMSGARPGGGRQVLSEDRSVASRRWLEGSKGSITGQRIDWHDQNAFVSVDQSRSQKFGRHDHVGGMA